MALLLRWGPGVQTVPLSGREDGAREGADTGDVALRPASPLGTGVGLPVARVGSGYGNS